MIQAQPSDAAAVTHRHHASGIHEFIFHQASRRAVDDCIALMRQHLDAGDLMEWILFDVRETGLLPVQYANVQFQQLFDQYPEHHHKNRTAYIHRGDFFKRFIIRLMRLMGTQHRYAFFEQREDALRWLLSDAHQR